MGFSDTMDAIAALPAAALYEQLAEECVELAKEALKMGRALRGENPTPREVPEIAEAVAEELADVMLCAAVLELSYSLDVQMDKAVRWAARIDAGAAL